MRSSNDEFQDDAHSKRDEAAAKFKEELRLLASDLQKDDLLEFITDECREDPALMDAFLLRFVTDESSAPPFDYSMMISEAALRAENEWGSLEEYPIKEVMEKLNLRALQQYHQGKYQDTLQICTSIIRDIPSLLEKLHDTIGIEGSYLLSFDILRKLLMLKGGLKEETDAKTFAIDLLVTNFLEPSGFDEAVWEVLYEASLNQDELATMMAYIDHSISSIQFSPGDPEWEMTDWLLRKVEFLKQDKTIGDALEPMKHYIGFTEIRDLFIEREITAGRLGAAKDLIQQGIEKATQSEKIATVIQYQNQLLEIAIQEEDQLTIRRLAQLLFLVDGRFDFEYYDLLKSTYPEVEWKMRVEEIITLLGGVETEVPLPLANVIAAILVRENELERLLILMRSNTNSFELIQKYYPALEEDHNVELIQIVQLSIEEYASKNSGRPAYLRLVQMLKFMSKIKGASPFVRSILRTLKQRYPLNTALIEILNQEFN